MDGSAADQMAWNLEDNRGQVAMSEEVLAVKEHIAIISLIFVERGQEAMQREGIACKQVRSCADVGADTGLAMYFPCLALQQKLALIPADRVSRRLTDLKLLRVDMFIPIYVPGFAEPEFEDDFFPRVAV